MKRKRVAFFGSPMITMNTYVSFDFIEKNGLEKGNAYFFDNKKNRHYVRKSAEWNFSIGGSAASSAMSASITRKIQTSFYGTFSDDIFGSIFEAGLAETKVENRCKIDYREASNTTVCIIFITPDKERTMLLYAGSADDYGKKDLVDEIFTENDGVFVDGYCFCGEKFALTEEIIRRANKSNQKVFITFSGEAAVVGFKRNFWKIVDEYKIDVLLGNQKEMMYFFDERDYIELRRKIINFSKEKRILVAFTRSSAGAHGFWHNHDTEAHITRKVNVLDTTGAGDYFAGGFVSTYLDTDNLECSLEVGNLMGTACVETNGSLISRERAWELEKMVDEIYKKHRL